MKNAFIPHIISTHFSPKTLYRLPNTGYYVGISQKWEGIASILEFQMFASKQ